MTVNGGTVAAGEPSDRLPCAHAKGTLGRFDHVWMAEETQPRPMMAEHPRDRLGQTSAPAGSHRGDSPPAAETTRPARVALALLIALALATMLPGPACAQMLKPWVPPSADSLLQWSSEAKARFKENTGDTVGGANFHAYELVGLMGRRLMRSLGRANLAQAHAVKAVIDSLGLDVDVDVDPSLPEFVLMMVRNPFRLTAYAVGFIYWYRGEDFRMQGAMFYGGSRPTMRAWWSGYADQPYSLGVIDHGRDRTGPVRMTLFRLSAAATYWDLLQFPAAEGELGAGEAAWVDLNGDDRPELMAWMRAENDTLFDACASCPFIIQEQTFFETQSGMQSFDIRILPSPYATFTLFVRLPGQGNRGPAARPLEDPAKLTGAIAADWGERRRAKAWVLEYGEAERWPRWLEFLHHNSRGDTRYVVHFTQKEGRWIIKDWVIPHRPGEAPADSAAVPRRAKKPAHRPTSPAAPQGKP